MACLAGLDQGGPGNEVALCDDSSPRVEAPHFDNTYLNVMIPLVVPNIEGDRRGQLVISPNVRSFDANLADRWLIPALCRFRLGRALLKAREVDDEPGDLYFFY